MKTREIWGWNNKIMRIKSIAHSFQFCLWKKKKQDEEFYTFFIVCFRRTHTHTHATYIANIFPIPFHRFFHSHSLFCGQWCQFCNTKNVYHATINLLPFILSWFEIALGVLKSICCYERVVRFFSSIFMLYWLLVLYCKRLISDIFHCSSFFHKLTIIIFRHSGSFYFISFLCVFVCYRFGFSPIYLIHLYIRQFGYSYDLGASCCSGFSFIHFSFFRLSIETIPTIFAHSFCFVLFYIILFLHLKKDAHVRFSMDLRRRKITKHKLRKA